MSVYDWWLFGRDGCSACEDAKALGINWKYKFDLTPSFDDNILPENLTTEDVAPSPWALAAMAWCEAVEAPLPVIVVWDKSDSKSYREKWEGRIPTPEEIERWR
ncbi:hypothetical protein KKE60_06735 [Patescibacteria group bacterium]|nr:hypothetical protein [Patescibacteria group bacterium]